MARSLRIQYPGAVYHVTHRGNERKDIFASDHDRQQFLKILSQGQQNYNIILHCYVLMDNHFHFLLETPAGNLSDFMRYFNITYTSFFNRKYKRCGHLYQGRFKSILVEKETYLSRLSRYIHLNPTRTQRIKNQPLKNQIKHLFTYPWSSLGEYLNPSNRKSMINYGYILNEFGGDNSTGRIAYKKQITLDLTSQTAILDNAIGHSLLGTANFINQTKNKITKHRDRERPAIGQIFKYQAQEKILTVISETTNLTQKEILTRAGLIRQIAMDILYRIGGLTNREIGEIMKIDYSTVSVHRTRLRKKTISDKAISILIKEIEAKCQG